MQQLTELLMPTLTTNTDACIPSIQVPKLEKPLQVTIIVTSQELLHLRSILDEYAKWLVKEANHHDVLMAPSTNIGDIARRWAGIARTLRHKLGTI